MSKPKTIDLRVLFGFWLLICIVFTVRAIYTADISPLFGDSDDAMRMVVVQDLLSGQDWFDHTQYRLNTPFGANIHWSRLVDMPMAAMLFVLQPLFGDFAIILVAWVWPLLLLLALLYISARLSVYLVGPEGLLPGLVLPVLSAAILVEFAPGRVDHHNVQIVLTLALLFAIMRSWSSPRWAIAAGAVAAVSIAIGMETLPQIITAIAVFGLFYVVDPSKGKTARLFGLTFALVSLLNLFIYLPVQNWANAACDALSIVHVGAALGVGVVFTILPFFALRAWVARLALGAFLGGSMAAGILLLFPQCLGGPYSALDPWLMEHWISQIVEAKPVWHSLSAIPAYTLGIIIPPTIALIVLAGIILRREKEKRAEWLILGLFLLTGMIVVITQVRGARLVAGMVAPIGGWAILVVRQKYVSRQSILSALSLMGTWLVFAGLAIAVLAGYVLPNGGNDGAVAQNSSPQQIANLGKNTCLQPDVFVDLASIPPERVMAPVDLGAHLLLFTHHSVVGAPYHRNQQGLMDSFKFFNLPLDEAKKNVEARGISLIVTCPYLPEMAGFADADEGSFVRSVKNGNLPDWLHDFTLPGSILNVYGVVDAVVD